MCLAVPGKIERIENHIAVIDYGVEKREADTSLLDVGKGDYVIVNGGFIIEKIPEKDALLALELIKNES